MDWRFAVKELLATFPRIDGAALVSLRIAGILVVAWIAAAVLHRLVRLFRERISARMADAEAVKRATTLGRAIRYLANVVVTLIAGMLILSEVGISVAPILGAAGVVGIAIGFGAQSLVKDYFTGFFLLLENQIRQGDVVTVADIGGLVEEVTLRFVRLRDYEGNVHYVPNGLITTVTNRSRGFAQAVIDVGIGYGEDIDEAFAVMREVAGELRADSQFAPKILDDIDIAGVESWGDFAIMLRCRFKVAPLEQWAVRREYLRRLKKAFDAAGIEIPFPHRTIYFGDAKVREVAASSLKPATEAST
ncbi:MAG: mechanosensitive ion channel family protein [Betaproteobacteria bacterium]|nr:MAG: mechanosensitive ion channel family protein [Betaproteobacteria bacterium]